ncbi:MAG TPA: insulinase family protein, partial [Bacteroidetes bacterium]|nr:insulinase family protein [Bacteroidota bacterium]
FQEVLQYAVEVHYTGDRPAERVADLLNRFYFEGKYPTKAAQYVSFSKKSYTEPTVFFLNRKDAIQSQIYFYKESEAYQRDRIWLLDAFNEYFGSGMSSLVFQEIREFRSLAYTARARIYTPDLPNQNNALIGYIGCQADKTKEALAVMTGLLRDMPAKPERIDGIRAAVTQTAYSSRPGFRDLSTTMVGWKHMGYTEDPAKARAAQFEKLNWQAMQHYYESAIGKGDAGKPLVIVITGDKNRIDMDDLKKYGKLIEVKQSEVMVK